MTTIKRTVFVKNRAVDGGIAFDAAQRFRALVWRRFEHSIKLKRSANKT